MIAFSRMPERVYGFTVQLNLSCTSTCGGVLLLFSLYENIRPYEAISNKVSNRKGVKLYATVVCTVSKVSWVVGV